MQQDRSLLDGAGDNESITKGHGKLSLQPTGYQEQTFIRLPENIRRYLLQEPVALIGLGLSLLSTGDVVLPRLQHSR